jgi:hypothetical protein
LLFDFQIFAHFLAPPFFKDKGKPLRRRKGEQNQIDFMLPYTSAGEANTSLRRIFVRHPLSTAQVFLTSRIIACISSFVNLFSKQANKKGKNDHASTFYRLA